MNFLIIGNVCIDNNSVEGASYEYFGSPAMYMNLILKNFADVDVKIITDYGIDFLQYCKSDILLPIKPNVNNTLRYQNIVVKGKRTQYAKNRVVPSIDLKSPEVLNAIKSADVIFLAPLIPNYSPDLIKSILELSKPSAIKLSIPQGYFRNFDSEDKVLFRNFEEADQLIQLFDYFILSENDYPNIEELAIEWSKKSNLKVIVTKEEMGADLVKNGRAINVPTIPINQIKDSTGSGDIFSGSFAYMFAKTRDEIEAIKFANKIAGICLSYTPDEISTGINFIGL